MDAVATEASDLWPAADLEHLGACPCCACADRTLIYEGLEDLAFRTAPGAWTFWRCEACRCGYLDPRPTLASIGRAYENYYTHGGGGEAPARAGSKAKLLVLVRQVAEPLAERMFGLSPGLRTRWRRFGQKTRHMPLPSGAGARLLDVGCGDGAFLGMAAALGFSPVGMDVDEAAVKVAAARGFEVRACSLPGSGLASESFEHVTMNNVLEHLHDPIGAVLEVHRLLSPGGRLWLTQPNLGALGLAEFGPYWRGLEPPRHLTLWETADLTALLRRCGFERVRALPTNPDAAGFYFQQSDRQRRGRDPYAPDPDGMDAATAKACEEAFARSAQDSTLGESLTIIGYRPR
jgi:SAM-dependent methyltransferase